MLYPRRSNRSVLLGDQVALDTGASHPPDGARAPAAAALYQAGGAASGTLRRGADSLANTDRQIIFVHVPRSGGRSIECSFGRYKFSKSSAFQRAQREVLRNIGNGSLGLCCGGHTMLPGLRKLFGPPTATARQLRIFTPTCAV